MIEVQYNIFISEFVLYDIMNLCVVIGIIFLYNNVINIYYFLCLNILNDLVLIQKFHQ